MSDLQKDKELVSPSLFVVGVGVGAAVVVKVMAETTELQKLSFASNETERLRATS